MTFKAALSQDGQNLSVKETFIGGVRKAGKRQDNQRPKDEFHGSSTHFCFEGSQVWGFAGGFRITFFDQAPKSGLV